MTLQFKSWPATSFGSLSSQWTSGDSQRGLYILTFADGSKYVGQSVQVIARVAAHRRRWADITGVAFAEVSQAEDLDKSERDLIHSVGKDAVLRNIAVAARPSPSPTVSLVIEPADLIDWHNTDHRDVYARADDAVQRADTFPRFRQLQKYPRFGEIKDILRAYVSNVIPHPRRTEQRLWAVTTLPTTNRSAESRRLACISCGPVETVVLIEFGPPGQGQIGGFLNTAPANGANNVAIRSLGLRPSISTRGNSNYRSIGRVMTVSFADLDALQRILKSPAVIAQARTLAINLMLKGTTSFGRYHDWNLADELL